MTEPYATQFADDVSSEMFVLGKAVPLLDTTQVPTADLHVEENKFFVSATGHVTIGMTLGDAVDRLGIRPLVFFSAWKCLDILLEYALNAISFSPRDGDRWTISEKVRHAKAAAGQAEPLSSSHDAWTRITAAYAASSEVRHALIHRRADVSADGVLVGTRAGKALPPVTREQQDSFIRVAQRVVAAITSGQLNPRDEIALLGELDVLAPLTGSPRLGHPVVRHVPAQINVHTKRGVTLDLTEIKRKVSEVFPTATFLDLHFVCDGAHYVSDIDDVPDGEVVFNPAALPWLNGTDR